MCEDDSAFSFKYNTAQFTTTSGASIDLRDRDFFLDLDEEACKAACIAEEECVVYQWTEADIYIDDDVLVDDDDYTIRSQYALFSPFFPVIHKHSLCFCLLLRFPTAVIFAAQALHAPNIETHFHTPVFYCYEGPICLFMFYSCMFLNSCRCLLRDASVISTASTARPRDVYDRCSKDDSCTLESAAYTIAGVKCFYPPASELSHMFFHGI